MRTETSSTRNAGLHASTTLVALVAVATTYSAMAMPRAYHAPSESRALLIEAQSVRHVAAAVAAIARDLLGGEQAEAVLVEFAWSEQSLPIHDGGSAIGGALVVAVSPPLIDQHLNLPPPIC